MSGNINISGGSFENLENGLLAAKGLVNIIDCI